MTRRRVLALCPSAWDKAAFSQPQVLDRYEVRTAGDDLLEVPPLWKALRFDVWGFLDGLERQVRGMEIDGVVGPGEYPACFLAAALSERLGLPSPSLRHVLLLGHKVHSREIQRAAVPEATPEFEPINPGAWRPRTRLKFPIFVKPVKGTMSIRARMARDESELRAAVRLSWRERLLWAGMLRPYAQLLATATDRPVPPHYFIGETPLQGEQVTVDGFAQNGRVTLFGVVDSVMFPGTRSFQRFDYPSRLPVEVQARLEALTARLMLGSGFDHGCFNVELFYDREQDRISIIEVNPRMSYQFGDLYERVDGQSSFEVQLQLSTGQSAAWRRRQGAFGCASSFVLRRFADARVLAVPSERDVAAMLERYPDATVQIYVKPGERLSDHEQDVESFRYGIVNLGGKDPDDLNRRWEEVRGMLPFGFG